MLSRIGDFINPAQGKGDAVGRAGEENRDREKGGKKKDDAPAEIKEDDTLFSVEAIRALLKQENVDAGSEAFIHLDLLQQHGILSIPIKSEQSIIAAIAEAIARLQGK